MQLKRNWVITSLTLSSQDWHLFKAFCALNNVTMADVIRKTAARFALDEKFRNEMLQHVRTSKQAASGDK